MKLTKISIIIVICLLATACVQSNLYYWGKYSHTQYQYIKNPSNETLQKHIFELKDIISQSAFKHKRVPPGVYIELAVLEYKVDPSIDVNQYLELELKNYPESAQYIDFIKKTILMSDKAGKE